MFDYPGAFDPFASRLYPPQTVVSLVPSVTESLYELGLGARVLGVTDYCTRPAEQVQYQTRVGGTKNPDIAKIAALAPELVIVNVEENRRQDADALLAAGLNVWVTHPRTVRDAINLLWTIMSVFEAPERSERVRHLERMYDWVSSATRAKERKGRLPTVFAPIWPDPLMTFNGDTYMHDILHVCGALSSFADRERRYPLAADIGDAEAYAPDDPRAAGRDTRYPRIRLEEVEAAQPDIILLPDEPFRFDEQHRSMFESLNIPAARHGRIHLVDGSLLTWHGTRLAAALQELPVLLEVPHVDTLR
ncbi:MAG: ABC transporter substrate-binding protein [Chloroflexota bacterium]|nr:MAG: ABC transporter substrate-binding protein [Chloroflexota bacterium]